jgi:hypothetical protein
LVNHLFRSMPWNCNHGSLASIVCALMHIFVSRYRARREGHVGAVAFSRTGDPAKGDFSDAKEIRKFGDVPD